MRSHDGFILTSSIATYHLALSLLERSLDMILDGRDEMAMLQFVAVSSIRNNRLHMPSDIYTRCNTQIGTRTLRLNLVNHSSCAESRRLACYRMWEEPNYQDFAEDGMLIYQNITLSVLQCDMSPPLHTSVVLSPMQLCTERILLVPSSASEPSCHMHSPGVNAGSASKGRLCKRDFSSFCELRRRQFIFCWGTTLARTGVFEAIPGCHQHRYHCHRRNRAGPARPTRVCIG
jgi:hypothetical protein